MREVQQAAQKVDADNARLRTLLRFTGVEDGVVEAWLRGDETAAGRALARERTSGYSPPGLRNVSADASR
jgi:hypothetical protein